MYNYRQHSQSTIIIIIICVIYVYSHHYYSICIIIVMIYLSALFVTVVIRFHLTNSSCTHQSIITGILAVLR